MSYLSKRLVPIARHQTLHVGTGIRLLPALSNALHILIYFIVPGSESHLQTTLTLLTKLQNVISDGNIGLQSCLPDINATLKKLLLTCNAACTVQASTDNVSFNNKQHIAPGKKMELQPRFSATVSTPGRKRQKNTL